MNIGDKVRLLRSNEEGRIVGFKEKNLVEIEIEDGFVIPALKDDVVVVSREESEYFGGTKPEGAPVSAPVQKDKNALQGIFLGFIPVNENDMSLYIFNFTEKDVVFNVSERYGGNSKSYAHGTAVAGNNSFITYLKLNNFEKWPEMLVQVIFINSRLEEQTPAIESIIRIKAKSFFHAKRTIPKINKEGYLIEVKGRPQPPVNTQELKTHIEERQGSAPVAAKNQKKGEHLTVDLHVEKLTDLPGALNPEEIVEFQLKTFEKELDNAIASGAESIKFIHGIGNGILRLRIHKFLSKSAHIRYFEDADKGRFGYGATVVHL